jgi:YegS/Rv2252/BmrU family lipid kinase
LKYYIIINPISGRGYAEKALPLIETGLRQHGLDFELVRTERPWHAAELAESAVNDGYDVIVTASGDGTANEALNGMMRAKTAGKKLPAFSILPVGTGNDMAYGLGMRGELDECIAALARDYRKMVDIGFVKGGDFPEGRHFANGVGIGFDAAVGFVAVKIRWARGLLAYLIAVIQTVFIYFKAPTVELVYNDMRFTQSSLMVSIMNGQRMGGGFYMAPQSELDDGNLDLCIASNPTRARIFGLIPHFLSGTQATQPEITTGRTDKIKVTALEGALPAHCDGETLCEQGGELEVQILPGALELVTMESPSA